MIVPTLLSAALLLGTDARALQAEKFLEEQDCDGLHGLFESYRGGKAEKDLAYARLLVRGASLCRPKDKVVALAMTERAALYAPSDYGVRTAHAESLLALDQRTEAAKLLDETIQAHPEGAVRARYLRGVLADEENEPAVAVQLLKPLAQDPEYAEKVQAALARNEQKLLEHSEARAGLKTDEERLRASAEKANEIALSRGPSRAGAEVWSARGTVKSGGVRTFNTKNVKAGTTYVLNATGACKVSSKATPKKKKKQVFEHKVDTFSIDFRAKVGSLDAVPLKVGESPERNQVMFRPLEDNPQLLIEDRGNQLKGVSCTISDVSVRLP